jgi:SAM-dependent methyltransferase
MQLSEHIQRPQASYDPQHFEPLFAVEDQHFWFCARNQAIAAILQQLIASIAPEDPVLEVGCGTGNTLRILEQVCSPHHVVGIDLFLEGLAIARKRVTCPLVQADLSLLPFEQKFGIIGLFDVLEHLPDDIQVLSTLHTILAPGGYLFLTVPAHQALWSYFDEAACHYRRYSSDDLAAKLRTVGFELIYDTPYMASILPLVWLGRKLAALSQRDQEMNPERIHKLARNEIRIIPIVNNVLTWILKQESAILAKRQKLPFGTSLLAIARKSQVAGVAQKPS